MRSAIVAPAHELHRMRMRRRKVSSNRKRVGNQARLLAFVASECADSGACAGVASSVCDFAAKERAQSWLDESPCAHVLRFFLAPHELRVFLAPHELRALWKRLEHFAQPFFCKWVQLLDANERCVVNLALGAIFQQIVIHFARAKDDPLYLVGGTAGAPRISSNRPWMNSSAGDDANLARNRLFGVIMMSGLMKSRFIWRRNT